MPYEIGGRADKSGNRFENNWVILKILEVFMEKLEYIIIEPLGEDEKGIDLWIGNLDGSREGQQCKGRNASREYWNFATINSRGIVENWKNQLENNLDNKVSLVSPLAFTVLEDLTSRARNTTESPQDFLDFQIRNSSQEIKRLFENLCKSFNLNYEDDHDLLKAVNYLSRIYYRQFPDGELKNLILSKIDILFQGEPEQIYAELLNFLSSYDIWGKRIDLVVLEKFAEDRSILYKPIERDTSILHRMKEINEEYKNNYIYFHTGLIKRNEADTCYKTILDGKSIVLHGKAGIGKSGCSANIITFCENNNIPYLAIKLDKHTPQSTAKIWSDKMGLSASIANCLHYFSKEGRAVLILDQLDALRWTHSHSGDALYVCLQVINQIQTLNKERKDKISIVMVCRTYDLENDRNIRNLFEKEYKDQDAIDWVKIEVKDLNESEIRQVIGNSYSKLSKKLRELVKIPSNLYIFEQLDKSKCYDNITTARELISEWWDQINRSATNTTKISYQELEEFKNKMIKFCSTKSKLYTPLSILQMGPDIKEFLSSTGFIVIQDKKVSFVHQSILDYFLVEYMFEEYYNDIGIEYIIGEITTQTPGKRYQVQMFMQQLLEISIDDFLSVGIKILRAHNIRYNVKYVFLEILSQIEKPNNAIAEFIIKYTNNKEWGRHIINSVISGKPQYVHILLNNGILDKWMQNKDNRAKVINIMLSISPNYTTSDVEFIKKYIFQNTEEALNWDRYFYDSIDNDSDELFELRIQFYDKYPELINLYLDINSMIKTCELRTVRLISLWQKHKIERELQTSKSYRFPGDLDYKDEDIFIKNYTDVVKIILPLLPKEDTLIEYSDWNARFSNNSLERACIWILKKASSCLAKQEPNVFIEMYKPYFATGNSLYNEILLDTFVYLPLEFADFIIEYLCADFDKTLFDKTSRSNDSLLLAKNVILKYSKICSKENYLLLENKIMQYAHPRMVELYKSRIKHNQANHGQSRVYWSFWGDLQRELLPVLPDDRKSKKAKDLLVVLMRNWGNRETIYKKTYIHGGFIKSSVDGKALTTNNWRGIITGSKIKKMTQGNWKEVEGGFIENTIESFSSTFSGVVSQSPQEMTNMVLQTIGNIDEAFIDALYSGIAASPEINNISNRLLEKLFIQYPCDYESLRAQYFFYIIEKKKDVSWSAEILSVIKDLAVKHTDPLLDESDIISQGDTAKRSIEKLKSISINSVRGNAANAICNLLWHRPDLFDDFRDTVEGLCRDKHPAVRLEVLYTLRAIYNIDRKWAQERIISLYKNDSRLVGFYYSYQTLLMLYSSYQIDVLEIVNRCYWSNDEILITRGANVVAGLFIYEDEFQDIINNPFNMNKKQIEAITEILVKEFAETEYNEKIKNVLLNYINSEHNISYQLSNLFYDDKIDLNRDRDFIITLLTSDMNQKLAHPFVHYLEKSDLPLIKYGDIILKIAESILNNITDQYLFGVGIELSKLIIALYDETSDAEAEKDRHIANRCLDIWDAMYKNQIGEARVITSKIMEL